MRKLLTLLVLASLLPAGIVHAQDTTAVTEKKKPLMRSSLILAMFF
jgi:hypothetical protein